MSSGYFSGVLVEIIVFAFRLYIGAVMLRFLMQMTRADFRFNSLARALVRITNPILIPLRRIVPGFRGVDWATVVLMLLLAMLEIGIVLGIGGRTPTAPGLLVLAAAELATVAVKLFFFAILLVVIVSWVAPDRYHPAIELIGSVTEPLMRPARQLLPPLGGLDLSPILVLLLLYLTERLLIVPLQSYGFSLL